MSNYKLVTMFLKNPGGEPAKVLIKDREAHLLEAMGGFTTPQAAAEAAAIDAIGSGGDASSGGTTEGTEDPDGEADTSGDGGQPGGGGAGADGEGSGRLDGDFSQLSARIDSLEDRNKIFEIVKQTAGVEINKTGTLTTFRNRAKRALGIEA